MSYTGSAKRIWKVTRVGPAVAKLLTVPLALTAIAVALCAVTVWYLFAVWLIFPYRMIRRSQRRNRRDALRLQEAQNA